MDRRSALALLAAGGLSAAARADDDKAPKKARKKREPKPTPDAAGKWVGSWGPLDAKPGSKAEHSPSELIMECTVTKTGDDFQAVFEGECGRPYKYTVKMGGRGVPGAVLFKGTTDLGEEDGGVYDWIGRADDKEFVGFYTSGGYVGLFRLGRPKADAPKAVPKPAKGDK